jgi:hypothetical protein
MIKYKLKSTLIKSKSFLVAESSSSHLLFLPMLSKSFIIKHWTLNVAITGEAFC